MSGHDELIGNIERKVVDIFYKSRIVLKFQKIYQIVGIVTGVGKLMWYELSLVLYIYIQRVYFMAGSTVWRKRFHIEKSSVERKRILL